MNTQTISDISQAEQGTSLWKDAWLRLRKNHLAVFGLVLLVTFIIIALLTPWIAPYSYQAQDLELGASPPSAAHWLGTDIFGRDLMTQIMYGGRISLAVGFVATTVALLIGVTWGAIAGYVGGRTDAVMMRMVDILYALPFMIFIVLLTVVFGRSMLLLFLAIGAPNSSNSMRLVEVARKAGCAEAGLIQTAAEIIRQTAEEFESILGSLADSYLRA